MSIGVFLGHQRTRRYFLGRLFLFQCRIKPSCDSQHLKMLIQGCRLTFRVGLKLSTNIGSTFGHNRRFPASKASRK
jgi:hypothetical protein